ncbi:hypothetical protein IFM89_016175 [Coptis chinensis]|uniref:FBD domain-containing protein n=1 Tax=Coptis chinensis TaxID=261450 RepID=A0A835GV83_9MAGN|nr:hypothetical protein IFM89_002046 [Coptis chinensis]KAF9588815.1 hypothetical protein IFM89_016175 [Coptis chinensis]
MHRVQEINLNLNLDSPLEFPAALFISSSLKVLKLEGDFNLSGLCEMLRTLKLEGPSDSGLLKISIPKRIHLPKLEYFHIEGFRIKSRIDELLSNCQDYRITISAPNLKLLVLPEAASNTVPNLYPSNYFLAQDSSKCGCTYLRNSRGKKLLFRNQSSFNSTIKEDHSHLKFVEIEGFIGCEDELGFLKLLLKNALVLENIIIVLSTRGVIFISESREDHLGEVKSAVNDKEAKVKCIKNRSR